MSGKDRERRLARERYERNLARRAENRERTKKRNAVIGAAVGVVIVLGGSSALAVTLGVGASAGQSGNSAGSDPTASSSTSAPPAGACQYSRIPDDKRTEHSTFVGLPPSEPKPDADFTATIKTGHGEIVIDLLNGKAPCTVNSFRFLADQGFYEKTRCHRILVDPSKILQCGDPSGTGKGGPGYSFPDENLEGAKYTKGTVAMANSGPDTNGSQFFLVFGDSSFPPNYTPFGTITSGIDVLQQIADAGVTGPRQQTPKAKVVIEDVDVAKET